MNPIALCAIFSVVLAGCVSTTVVQAPSLSSKTICIVDNPSVRQAFRDAYERRIAAHGYDTKIVDASASCDIVSTYSATYGNHWGVYLATATLTINDHGKEVGRATYKAPYASPEKHGRVEGKIEALVAQLLPK